MKIGIPRAMSFYENYPFFHGFFKALGIEVVLSDKTTKNLNVSTLKVVVIYSVIICNFVLYFPSLL